MFFYLIEITDDNIKSNTKNDIFSIRGKYAIFHDLSGLVLLSINTRIYMVYGNFFWSCLKLAGYRFYSRQHH